MARDYKHRARKRKRPPEAPGWQWGLAGLSLGLFVALYIYVDDRRPGGPAAPEPIPAEPVSAALTDDPEDAGEAPEKFSFYELLPKFEVVIPEQDREVRPDSPRTDVTRPGHYVLQAGSFRDFSDADRRRAEIALRGIESRIQKVTIDNDQTWHRVRIGPVDDLATLGRWRERLREADIEALVIRVGD